MKEDAIFTGLTAEYDRTAASVTDAPANDAHAPFEWLTRRAFRAGGVNLLLAEGTLCEVVDLPPLARVPNTESWLLGLVNLRGSVIPVFDLARAFGQAGSGGRGRRLLVIGSGDQAAGVVIDDLPTLERFAPSDRVEQASLPAALEDCTTACFAKNGKRWVEFAPAGLFSALARQVAVQ
jgi:twitching motility protein PilI